ncbi:enoyl-CoA hydratase/isomerase family protein [Hydrogenophaga sp. BPS33]|uniref:enoyl-CoA hydratase/isomerase family protein n=1 Tax=Hydrogenophaga sp. BPS33 TaxID=2651974 RepID=UPI00131FBA1A|nr:enoyl-CoA hydratase/isomerase family protein [Hydrogenophaga sp. BPS33]QHE83542.1 enoyl-CoA hydratase/isomerase family protein [Hydrogenophaga sp. BPS33]
MTAHSSAVILRTAPPVAWVTLNRPERGNACSTELVQGLEDALDRAEQSGARALVLQGSCRHFCTGFDLSGLDNETDDSLLARFTRLELLLQRVARAPLLTVAIAQSRAIGAGADLFTACDVRMACANAHFAFPGARGFGLVLGSRRLAARVGDAVATAWIANATTIDAASATATGLATHLVNDPAQAASLVETLLLERASTDGADTATLRSALEPHACDHDAHDLARLVRSAARPGLRERIAAYAGLRNTPTSPT